MRKARVSKTLSAAFDWVATALSVAVDLVSSREVAVASTTGEPPTTACTRRASGGVNNKAKVLPLAAFRLDCHRKVCGGWYGVHGGSGWTHSVRLPHCRRFGRSNVSARNRVDRRALLRRPSLLRGCVLVEAPKVFVVDVTTSSTAIAAGSARCSSVGVLYRTGKLATTAT